MVKVKKSGFTLIEVLMIVFLLGIVLVMGSTLLFSILKGGTKTEVIKEVKQNGNFVMATMTRMIRNAKGASCDDPVNPEEWVRIVSIHDDQPTTFACLNVGGDTMIASNGARLTSERVKVNTCQITCEGTPARVVNVSFTLSQKEASTQVEQQSTQNFQTKVSLRIYE